MKNFLKNWNNTLWAIVGVIVAIVGVEAICLFFSEPTASNNDPKSPPAAVEQVLARHLGWAEEASQSGVLTGAESIRMFFAEARNHTQLFAEDVLGFNSKWKMACDYFSGTQEHEKFLQERFEARVFAPEELEEVVESSVNHYLNFLGDVDSQLLVRLEADLGGITEGELAPDWDRHQIAKVLATALAEASQAVESDFRGMIGREAASMTAGEVLALVGVRLMTSAGILSAGAGSGMVTFGTGLLIGIATDFVVTEVYNQIYDPVGELEHKVNAQLLKMEELILRGDIETPGLEDSLQDYAARRNHARKQALNSAVLGNSQQISDIQ